MGDAVVVALRRGEQFAKSTTDGCHAKDHRGKIGGLFKLLETVGDIAYRSDIPGVSLFGQIINAYVKYKDGHWSTIGPLLVIVDGETARAGRLVWKRMNTE
ncbi:MAG: hypothetical protein K8R59_05500 [Thermoanaerobaculales bacterium]|nr:hypothetical protein [Thermoanaerobaculales bacterium]